MSRDWKGVTLTKEMFTVQRVVPENLLAAAPCIQNHLKMETKKLAYGFAMRIKSFMLSKEWRGEETTMMWPASVWDHVKQDYAPDWFIRRFPVRYIEQRFVQKILKCCPHSTMMWPPGAEVHLEWMVEGPR